MTSARASATRCFCPPERAPGVRSAKGARPTRSSMVRARLRRSDAPSPRCLGLERTTLVRNLKVLTQNGWIEPVAAEGRGLRHRLTPSGQAILEAAIPLWQQAQGDLEAKLMDTKPDEARLAMRALRKAAYTR